MCGIWGFFSTTTPLNGVVREWARNTTQVLQHRGPDGSGILEFPDCRCILGHTRLSIIDIPTGAQPLSNEDGTVWIVFNGEIYNYLELREKLSARHLFRTNSDTEVLVHLYEEKGERLVDDLVGMFAFAILDQRDRRLLLVRDRFGEKPLYYAETPQGIAFASELKALKEFPGLDLGADASALAQYMALGYIPAPRTHLREVKKLRASERIQVSTNGGVRSDRYWALNFQNKLQGKYVEILEEFNSLFSESVRLRLRSDVPLGAFLSGGIDSTLVVAQARKLMPEVELRTFCAGFDDPLLDERSFARTASSVLCTHHEEIAIDPTELLNSIWDITLHYDEPYADYSCLPTYAVSAAASRYAKVMLSGDGADELFGGYSSYFKYYSLNSLRNQSSINSISGAVARVWPKGRSGKGVLDFLSKSELQLLREKSFNEPFAYSVIRGDYHDAAAGGIEELDQLLGKHKQSKYPGSLMEVQATELTLPEQLMAKVDRASMKTGLECRAPFLDHRLAEFAAGLPEWANFKEGFGKYLLRTALPAAIPESIRWRQKRGFTPPLATWFRTSLREPLLESIERPPAMMLEFCDAEAIRPLYDAHVLNEDDLQDLLFRWLVLAKHFERSSFHI